jgi:hypothetical protein
VELGQLGAGADAELGEDVAEVEVDRAGAEEQLGGNLPGGEPADHEPRHLELLWGELPKGRRVAPTHGLPAGPQLQARPLRPGCRTQALEHVEGSLEMCAGVDPASGPAQQLTVGQLGAGLFERAPRPPVVLECLLEPAWATRPSESRPCAWAARACAHGAAV